MSNNNTGSIHSHCAQERLDKWQADNKDLKIKPGDHVKIKFTDGDINEWMWVFVVAENDGMILGRLNNDPVKIKNIVCDQAVWLKRDEICEHFTGPRIY